MTEMQHADPTALEGSPSEGLMAETALNDEALGEAPIVSGPDDADGLLIHLGETMEGMQAVIESETRLVRAAKLREAMRLHDDKNRLVLQYKTAVRALKVNGPALRAMMPERMERIEVRHAAFAKSVSANLEVLRIARDVSENLVRSVSTELHEAHASTPYSHEGRLESAPRSTPLSVDKGV